MDVDRRVGRMRDGACHPVPPSEWLAWARITGNIVRTWEFEALANMDVAYCATVNGELENRREVEAEKAKADTKRK